MKPPRRTTVGGPLAQDMLLRGGTGAIGVAGLVGLLKMIQDRVKVKTKDPLSLEGGVKLGSDSPQNWNNPNTSGPMRRMREGALGVLGTPSVGDLGKWPVALGAGGLGLGGGYLLLHKLQQWNKHKNLQSRFHKARSEFIDSLTSNTKMSQDLDELYDYAIGPEFESLVKKADAAGALPMTMRGIGFVAALPAIATWYATQKRLAENDKTKMKLKSLRDQYQRHEAMRASDFVSMLGHPTIDGSRSLK